MTAMSLMRKEALEPFGLHRLAADAEKATSPARASLKRPHET